MVFTGMGLRKEAPPPQGEKRGRGAEKGLQSKMTWKED